MGTQNPEKSNTTWYIAAVVIIIIIVVVGVVAYQATRPTTPSISPSPSATASPSVSATPSPSVSSTPSPSSSGGTVKIDIYAGEVSSTYGFGNSSSSIASPGPSLTFKVGDKVTVTLHNVGTTAHNWALVTAKTDGNTNLAFTGAQIASASNPIAPGGTGTVTFTVDKAGSFYYICQVDAHVTLGMWGIVTVTS